MTLSHLEDSEESHRRVGVTHYIRTKLNFYDETLWKRFSARRLELIDAMDLSYRKASEQESEIQRVAETLRIEFNYGSEYVRDFDRLVRAAIQSVRRNRKRSLKQAGNAKKKSKDLFVESPSVLQGTASPENEFTNTTTAYSSILPDDDANSLKFVSEIARLQTDSQDETDSYSRSLRFTLYDKSRAVIDSITQPKTTKQKASFLPQLTSRALTDSNVNGPYAALVSYIERSKTCAESTFHLTPNLEALGHSAVQCSIFHLFETSLRHTSPASIEYLTSKIKTPLFLAAFYRELDPHHEPVDDDVAMISLCTVIGGCIKDFGFGVVMPVLCDCLCKTVTKSYPLLTRPSLTIATPAGIVSVPGTSTTHLDSLATIATNMQDKRSVSPSAEGSLTNTKSVTLRYMNNVLAFSYPASTSAVPRLDELLDNGRSAFHVSNLGDSRVLCLRNMRDGTIINSDSTLEVIFKRDERIELELYTHDAKTVPIAELTSTISPNQDAIILPPVGKLGQAPNKDNFRFLLKRECTPPLPNFQPLL